MSKYTGNIVTTGADAGYSVYFDGTGDYLSIADNAALDMGASDFTVELWVYPTATPGAAVGLYSKRSGNSAYGGVLIQLTNTLQPNAFATFDGSSWGITINSVTGTCALNTWNHIAFTRSGGTATLWLNGVSIGSDTTAAGTIPDNTSAVCIGAGAADGTTVVSACYISNVRAVKGTALYTAAFTPPTQLLNITNTSLLTCNSPAIVDQSSNAFAITANGNAAVSNFTPFAGYRAYNPAAGAATPGVWTLAEAMQASQTRQWNMYDPYFRDTVLALRSGSVDGLQNNTFLDSSSNNFTITRNGNTTQGTFTPFSPTGWSVYMNADRQSWVSISSASLALGTGDFEISFYMYYINGTYIMGTGNTSGSWAFTSDGSFRRNTLAADFITGGATARTWNKIRCVRISGVAYLYVNDVLRGSAADTQNYTNSGLGIGNFTQGAGGSPNFASEVYISNLKIIKAGTTILDTFRDNRFIDNSPTPLTVTPNANATYLSPYIVPHTLTNTNTAYSPVLHGGSGYFDGMGDYLSSTITALTGTFTIEFWFYRPLSGNNYCFTIGDSQTGGNTSAEVYIGTSGTVLNYWANNAAQITGTPAATGQWVYLAVTRDASNVVRLYQNGAQVGGTYTQAGTLSTALRIGTEWYGGASTGVANGYLGPFRVSNIVRTVTTVPATAFSNDANTVFLANFTNASITDATGKNVIETVGNAQASVSVKNTRLFGPPPTTMYFDGTGDWLVAPSSASFDILSFPTFTIEAWVYANVLTDNSGYGHAIAARSSGSNGWIFRIKPTSIEFVYPGAAANASTVTLTTGQWYHLAVVKESNTVIRYYVNGVQYTPTYTQRNVDTAVGLSVGADYLNGTNKAQFNGYISDFRITRYARYLSAFTPPTSLTQNQ